MLCSNLSARYRTGFFVLYQLFSIQYLPADQSALNRELRQQSSLGKAAKVAELLKQGADPNVVDENGQSALSAAVGSRDSNVLQLLLDAGAKPDPTAMLLAGRFNRTESLKLLLEAGGDPDAALSGAAGGGHFRLVRRLLDKGASAKSEEGSLALHGATVTGVGGWEMVQMLLEAGADPNAVTKRGQTPLHTAASANANLQIVKALVEAGAKLDAPDEDGLTPVRLAATRGNKSLYTWLVTASGGEEPRPARDLASPMRSKSTSDLLAVLRSNQHESHREVVRELASRGKDIMPEVLKRLEAGDDLAPYNRLFVAMGPNAEAAWPKLEELLGEKQQQFVVLSALQTMRDMKRGDVDELALGLREKAAATFYKKAVASKGKLAELPIISLVNLGEVSVSHLLSLLRSGDSQHQRLAALHLERARFADPEIQAELIKLTGEGVDHHLRVNAIQALGRFGEANEELQTVLLNIMKKPPFDSSKLSKEERKPFDQWQQVSDRAGRSLARFGPDVVDPLIPLLSPMDGPQRHSAMIALREIRHLAAPKMVKLLTHEDKAVATAANEVLNRAHEAARGSLTALRSEQDGSILWVANSLEFFSDIGVESIKDIVKEALPDLFAVANSDEHALVVRSAAVHAALKIDRAQSRESNAIQSAIPALIRVLERGTLQEQLYAAESLGQIGAPAREALPLLRERLRLPSEEIDVGGLPRDALQRQAEKAIAAIERKAEGASK